MMMKTLAFALALLCGAPPPSAASSNAGAPLVLLPLDNVSGAEEAQPVVAKLLADAVAKRGWTAVPADTELLEAERVRYLDSLEPKVLEKIVASSGAAAILSATIYTYNEGRNPSVAIAARIVRADRSVAWADLVALSADDTEGTFGFGRKTSAASVAEVAVDELTRKLPRPGDEASNAVGPKKRWFKSSPASFRASAFDAAHPQRVAVLPFDNLSSNSDASRVVADVLSLRLASEQGFELIDPATLRAAALAARIGSFREIGSDDLAHLASALGTSLFIRGTIYDYSAQPGVEMELSLVDISTGKVLWATQHARKGRDYVGFLMRGNVTTPVSLTDHVIGEMIQAMGGQHETTSRTADVKRVARARGGAKN